MTAMVTTADRIALYKGRAIEAIESIKASEVAALLGVLRGVRERGDAVYVVGNGGSYANAAHLVLHLRNVGLRAFDLMADNAWLTAQSNDSDYGRAAALLLARLAHKNDVAFIISGSGKSDNVVRVAEAIQPNGLALLGFGGGLVSQYAAAVTLPQTEYGPIEDAHSVVVHILHEALKDA